MKSRPAPAPLLHGMRLRLGLAFLLAFLAMGGVSLLALQQSLLPGFRAIDEEGAVGEAARVVGGIDLQLTSLDLLNRDWATWDDMVAFVDKPDPAFSASLLNPAALKNADVSFVMILRRDGTLVAGHGSQAPDRAAGLQALLADRAGSWQPAAAAPAASGPAASATPPRHCGVLRLGAALHLVCWNPILRSDMSGQPAGTVVMGRELDPAMTDAIARQADVRFALQPSDDPARSEHKASLRAGVHLAGEQLGFAWRGGLVTVQYTLLDVAGRPAAYIHVDHPAVWTAQGTTLLARTSVQLALVAALTCLVLMLCLHWLVVKPMSRMTGALHAIRQDRSWQTQVAVPDKGELGSLATEINGLLAVIDSQVQDLNAMSMTDALTGLANRRRFDLRLADEFNRMQRHPAPCALLLLDIDFFKQFNDLYGHAAGDAALQAVAGALQVVTRENDLAARVGGEEFAVLLPQADAEAAMGIARRLQARIGALALPHAGSSVATVLTASVGVAVAVPGAGSPEALLVAADQALYAAKHAGRNRIEPAALPG